MDNIPEIKPTPENIEIPENWDFRYRDTPGLKIDQIDLDQRFIAFYLPTDPHTNQPLYGDYFFDNEGKSLVNRHYYKEGRMSELGSTSIDLVGDLEIDYWIDARPENFVDYGKHPIRRDIGISVDFREKNLNGKIGTRFDEILGAVYYEGQLFNGVHFGYNFAPDPNRDKHLFVPSMDFDIKIGTSDTMRLLLDPKNRDNEALELWGKGFGGLQPQINQNGAVYLDKNGDKIFQVDWKIEEDELEPSRGRLAVFSQTHIPSGIVKTLRALLRLNLGEVKDAVFSRPPYQKDERGNLIVPWRNIDRIVGATLSYSYPPPSPQK